MKVFETKIDLIDFLKDKKSIGFVPTMGALHSGHVSLIELSAKKADITVCSIFVNPTQFNDKNDLINYPRTIDKDLAILEKHNCDVVFIPSADEIYPRGEPLQNYNFETLDILMEGEHRPGHFNGMANVVERLFTIVKPTYAFFGEKDFQQLCVVKELVNQLKLPIQIIPGIIIRENDGLAMSSRNALLTPEERLQAAGIYKSMSDAKNNSIGLNPTEVAILIKNNLKNYPLITPEYVEIRNAKDLALTTHFQTGKNTMVFIAVKLGKVRLIDNLQIYS